MSGIKGKSGGTLLIAVDTYLKHVIHEDRDRWADEHDAYDAEQLQTNAIDHPAHPYVTARTRKKGTDPC